MHFVKAKGLLSPRNGMNIYRGCSHGCIYCDSRSKCYEMNHDFEDIEVKENAPELLEEALRRKRKGCMIATGSMSDPYIPLERRLRLTRRALELAYEYGCGFTLITKSADVLRDIDLLAKINEKTKCVVQMTLTTADKELCAKLEPGVSGTGERFAALKALREAGIPTVVWLTPLLPFINDTAENVSAILEMCAGAGVYGVIFFGAGLTLREGNREYFYAGLDRLFPGLKEKYIYTYGNEYEVTSPKNRELSRLVGETCAKAGIVSDSGAVFSYLREFEEKSGQISWF